MSPGSTNIEDDLLDQTNAQTSQKSLHRPSRMKLSKLSTTGKRKLRRHGSNTGISFNRDVERTLDMGDMYSTKDSLYSLACQNFDLTSIHEDDYAYEESFIKNDTFTKTYNETILSKRNKTGTNNVAPSITDKEIELFKNITNDMPYELSHFPKNIQPERIIIVKKMLEEVKLSTTLCILTYILDLSNVHLRDHFPYVYVYSDALEPPKFSLAPSTTNEDETKSSEIMDGTTFDHTTGGYVDTIGGGSLRTLFVDAPADDKKLLKLSNPILPDHEYTREKPTKNFSELYKKCITDKYLFRFGHKRTVVKYPYTHIIPYYPPTVASNQQFKIELIYLMGTNVDEPYFASITFVDVKFKQKISEDYLFNFNDSETVTLLEDLLVKYDDGDFRNKIEHSKTVILNTSFSSIDDIYIVLRIHALKRDIKKKDYRLLYNSLKKTQQNKRTKEDLVVRLLKRPLLLNSLGWYGYSLKQCLENDPTIKSDVEPLQKDMSKLQLNKISNPKDSKEMSYIRGSHEIFEDKQDKFCDEEIIDFLLNYHRNGSFKKIDTLAVDFKFSVTKLLSTDDYNIIPNYKTIEQNYKKANIKHPFAISLEEFYPNNYMLPIKNYRNVAFVELKMLYAIGQKNFPSKDLICKVELINGADLKPIKCFYNQFNRTELQNEYYTALNSSSKPIYFKETVKVELPLDFHPKTHFLFTFYGVTFEKNHDQKFHKHSQTYLPLLNDDVLNVGRHSLPVADGEFGRGYEAVQPTSLTSISCADWIENQKPLFVIKFNSHSSSITSSKFVCDVLQCDPSLYFDDTGNCVYFKNMVLNYNDKSQICVVRFLYPLMQKIMSYFFMNEGDIVPAFHQTTSNKFNKRESEMYSNVKITRILLDNVFLLLIIILNNARPQLEPFSDTNGRSPLLGIYSNYMFNPKYLIDFNMKDFMCSFDNKSSTKQAQSKGYNEKIKYALENFVRCWVTLRPQIFQKTAKFSWFLFEMIIKMIYFLDETSTMNPNIVNEEGKSVKLRDSSLKIAFSPEFYKHLIRLCVRLGRHACISLVSDENDHDIIGSSLTHFIIQIIQVVEPYIVRIMIKLFFDEIIVVEGGHLNTLISEYKLNILNILMADERIGEIDIFMLAAQPKSELVQNELQLLDFLTKSAPIINVFVTEVIHSLWKEPDLSKKTFELLFCYILYFCEGKCTLPLPKDVSKGNHTIMLFRAMSSVRNKLSHSPKHPPSVKIDRSNMHTYVSMSLYPVMVYIIEFFGQEYRAQIKSNIATSEDRLDFIFLRKFSGFSCDNVKSLVLTNMSKYGNIYMTNLCLLFLWTLNSLDNKFLLRCVNEWSALKSSEFGVTLYSCLLVFQLIRNETKDPAANATINNDSTRGKFKDSKIFKNTDLRDGSLTKSNALALLKTRRIKKCRTRMWAGTDKADSEETVKKENFCKIIYAKDDIIAECSSFILHIIDLIINASITLTLHNDEVVHKCLLVLVQTLCCREPVPIKLDVMYLLMKVFTLTPSWLFGKDYLVISELFKALIILFCSNHAEIRNKAIDFCYSVFILNLNCTQNINATSGILHFVISSVNLNDNNDFEKIFHAISILKKLPSKEKTKLSQPQPFLSQFESCIGFTLVILTNRSKINYLEKCGCTISMIQTICDIIEQCHDAIDLRLYWLYTLGQVISLDDRFSNAAMCNMHMVVAGFEYTKINGETNQFKYIHWNDFKVLSDNLAIDVTSDPKNSTAHSLTCQNFTPKSLVKLLQEAGHYLKKAHSFLFAYKTYTVANELSFRFGFYDEIMSVTTPMNDCLKSSRDGDYGLATYFKVGFYGDPFDSICNTTEYILHYTRIISLSEVCTFLNEAWSKVLNGKELSILNSPYEVDRNELKENECYIQVTSVEPYHEPSYFDTQNEYEKRYNISKFIFSAPYVMESPNKFVKSQSKEFSLKTQSSRQTIIYTKFSAPYMSPLIPICNREHNFLTPIEVSIADLKKRSDDLLSVCAMKVPNLILLEGLLQGCVSTSVNQGPLAIAETFLQPTISNDDNDHMKLINTFKMLLTNSKKALETFKSHSDPSRIRLCEHMESNYKKLQTELLKYFLIS